MILRVLFDIKFGGQIQSLCSCDHAIFCATSIFFKQSILAPPLFQNILIFPKQEPRPILRQ
jgi:hypothetical protein